MKKMIVWIGLLFVLSISGCSMDWGCLWECGGAAQWTPAEALGLEKVVTLEQGWSASLRLDSWHKDQGARILPTGMFLNLEQADSENLFREHTNIARYRYVPQEPDSKWNPEGLPLGFTTDGKVMGITCSACHSTLITYRGTGMLIDGAPSIADFQAFIEDLVEAVERTRRDADKFGRFAVRMLDENAETGRIEALRAELTKWGNRLTARKTLNYTTYRYGYARVDAFGEIFNSVSSANMEPASVAQANRAQPNAPVSFPFLWGTPQSDRVQWNGIARNRKRDGSPKLAGPLGRNVGEVLGVFGRIDVTPGRGYESSVKIVNVAILERWLKTLEPPPWPVEIFGSLDGKKKARGMEIYSRKCAACHQLVEPLEQYDAKFIALDKIGTDPTMAMNALAMAETGFLEGEKMEIIRGDEFGAKALKAKLLKNQVLGVLAGNIKETLVALGIERFEYSGSENLHDKVAEIKEKVRAINLEELAARLSGEEQDEAQDGLLNYKARPLNGIWATAPYLHNGSVPTLYDLLLPEEERPKTFSLGGWEYDPVKVGYAPYSGPNAFLFNTAPGVTGNSNKGHIYGAPLSEEDRWAVVEYLKSL